jgi:uncharacterized protein YgbK (DUF1537 family)
MTAATSNLPAGPLLGCVADDYTGGTDVASALRARRWLSDEGIGCLYFKYCSTFDSTDADLAAIATASRELPVVTGAAQARARYPAFRLDPAATPDPGDLQAKAVGRGVRRVVIAGGETSGAVVDGLGIDRVVVAREEDVGVPWLVAADPAPLALLLKSGNCGRPDLLVRAAATAEPLRDKTREAR